MGFAGLFGLASGATLLLTGLVRRYALARSLIDRPNERSSHTRPTPRGGGLAIVVVVLTGVASLFAAGLLPAGLATALAGGGLLVAAVGFLDDRGGLPAAVRFAVHLIAAAWGVFYLHGMPQLSLGASAVHLGWGGAVLALLGTVWAVNFYNFMDGIDGLAAGEALVVGLAGAVLLAPLNRSLAAVSLLTGAAAAGFLPWNWQPARIFMGDVGSGFLGFVFGILALASEKAGALPALIWILLLGVFFADATVTLMRRMFRKERWYAAHRSHAYQRAIESGYSHSRVTLVILLMDLGLVALAWIAVRQPSSLVFMLVLGGTALAVCYVIVERRRPMLGAEPSSSPPSEARANSRSGN
jgi:glycosyltransferase WbpL